MVLAPDEKQHISNMVFAVSHYIWKTTGNLNLLEEIIKEHKIKLTAMAKKKKITKSVVKPNDIHDCPPGTTWNGVKCVDDLPK